MTDSPAINHFAMTVRTDERDDATRASEAADPVVHSLVMKARRGDAEAFEGLVIKFERQVMGSALRLLGNIDDARDAAQEVFLRLHKSLDRIDPERALGPWLYRVTVNVSRDIGRRRQSSRTVSFEQESEQGTLDSLASTTDVEADARHAQEKRIVNAALATLPEKERAAIVLRDVVGLDTKEVAQILKSSESTVRSQISMARARIKKYRDKLLSR